MLTCAIGLRSVTRIFSVRGRTRSTETESITGQNSWLCFTTPDQAQPDSRQVSRPTNCGNWSGAMTPSVCNFTRWDGELGVFINEFVEAPNRPRARGDTSPKIVTAGTLTATSAKRMRVRAHLLGAAASRQSTCPRLNAGSFVWLKPHHFLRQKEKEKLKRSATHAGTFAFCLFTFSFRSQRQNQFIRWQSSRNSARRAAAAFGKRLVSVMPGEWLTSSTTGS